MVGIESVLVSISFIVLFGGAIEAHNLLSGPNTAQTDATVEILTRLKEERAIIEAIANKIRLPDILAWIFTRAPEDNDVRGNCNEVDRNGDHINVEDNSEGVEHSPYKATTYLHILLTNIIVHMEALIQKL